MYNNKFNFSIIKEEEKNEKKTSLWNDNPYNSRFTHAETEIYYKKEKLSYLYYLPIALLICIVKTTHTINQRKPMRERVKRTGSLLSSLELFDLFLIIIIIRLYIYMPEANEEEGKGGSKLNAVTL